MCGLFGTIRPHQLPAAPAHHRGRRAHRPRLPRRRTRHRLRRYRHPAQPRAVAPLPHINPAVREHTLGRWRIRTALGAFSTHLPDHHQVRSNLASARVVLGHTRWATQGATTLDNASPLNAGDIIGTHNGDVTAPTRNGSTDSAWLFDQLNNGPHHQSHRIGPDRPARPRCPGMGATVAARPGLPGPHRAVPAGHRHRPRGSAVVGIQSRVAPGTRRLARPGTDQPGADVRGHPDRPALRPRRGHPVRPPQVHRHQPPP